MKNILIAIATLLLLYSCKTNKIARYPPPKNKALMDRFLVKYPVVTPPAREIRCYLSSYYHYATRMLIFRQYQINSNWVCYSLTYCRGPLSGNNLEQWKEQNVPPDIWQKLKQWKITTLPDEYVARKNWKSSRKTIQIYIHGTSYYFEAFIKGRLTNSYSYDNPFDELTNWDIKNKELTNVTSILTLLNKEYDFNNKDKSCELMAGASNNTLTAHSTAEQKSVIQLKK